MHSRILILYKYHTHNNCSYFYLLAYRPCFPIRLCACKCGRRVAPSPPACPSGHGGDKKLRQWQNNGTKGKNKPRPNIIDKRVFGRIWISPNCIWTHNQALLMPLPHPSDCSSCDPSLSRKIRLSTKYLKCLSLNSQEKSVSSLYHVWIWQDV